jgi:hypothetical protein
LIRAPPIRNPDSKSLDSSSKDFTSMKSIPRTDYDSLVPGI